MPYPLWWRVIQPYPLSSRHRTKLSPCWGFEPRPIQYAFALIAVHLQCISGGSFPAIRLCFWSYSIAHQFPRLKLIRCLVATLDKLYVVLPTLSSAGIQSGATNYPSTTPWGAGRNLYWNPAKSHWLNHVRLRRRSSQHLKVSFIALSQVQGRFAFSFALKRRCQKLKSFLSQRTIYIIDPF